MMSIQEIQDAQYSFPYHYIPYIENNGKGEKIVSHRYLDWSHDALYNVFDDFVILKGGFIENGRNSRGNSRRQRENTGLTWRNGKQR